MHIPIWGYIYAGMKLLDATLTSSVPSKALVHQRPWISVRLVTKLIADTMVHSGDDTKPLLE